MLKAKLKSSPSRRKQAAMKEVSKLDNDKGMFVRLTAKEMKKLRIELAEREMTMSDWVKEKIGEI